MTFVFKGEGDTILFQAPEAKDITIPKHVKEIYGDSDKNYAFFKAHLVLMSVTFPPGNSLVKISPYAFYQCSKLKTINLESCESLTEINNRAFSGCGISQDLRLPNKLQKIDHHAFYQCSEITSVYVPASVTSIGSSSFDSCGSMVSFTIDPETKLTSMDVGVFGFCKKLESFTIPKSFTSFKNVADKNCIALKNYYVADGNNNLASVEGVLYSKNQTVFIGMPPGRTDESYTILDTVTLLGSHSFSGSGIKNVVFPDNLERIEEWCFYQSSISSLIIKPKTRIIEGRSFSECLNLVSVVFPDNMDKIGNGCFAGCTKLETCTLPKHFNSIGGGVFASCPKVSVTVPPDSDLEVKDNLAYDKKSNALVLNFNEEKTDILIVKDVKSIGTLVFYDNQNVKSVTFETGIQITHIHEKAFSGTNITSIVFPDSLQEIGIYAFEFCNELTTVKFGSGIKIIKNNAFSECQKLISIEFKESTVELVLQQKVFNLCSELKLVNFGSGIKEIGSNSFYGCSSLDSISLPKTINKLGERAFSHCSKLKRVMFAKEAPITNIAKLLFEECVNLDDVTFSDKITTFESHCFTETAFKTFTLPPSLQEVGDYAFKDCGNLTTFIIPVGSQLKNFGYGSFWHCFAFEKIENSCTEFKLINNALYKKDESELIVVPPNTSIKFFTFPEKLKIIRQSALLHCINIIQILIPSNSVEKIENNAFEDCFGLLNINIPESVQTIQANAFLNCNKLQCGLFIETRTTVFLDNLVKSAKMPSRCIDSCQNICKTSDSALPQVFMNTLFSFLFMSI